MQIFKIIYIQQQQWNVYNLFALKNIIEDLLDFNFIFAFHKYFF